LTRVLASANAVDADLVVGFGLQRDAQALDTDRIAVIAALHPRDADARLVVFSHKTGKQI
jgi:hypothetical protein